MTSRFKRLKSTVKTVRRSKDGRILLANFGYLSLLQISSYIFPLLTIPYLARVIGVEKFGKIAFAAAIMIWFRSFMDWGFNLTATRDIAIHRNNHNIVSDIFNNVLWAKVVLMIFSYIILSIMTLTIPLFRDNWQIIAVTSTFLLTQAIMPVWFFQALEKMKFITIFGIISKTVFTFAVFVFIKNESQYLLQPIFITLGNAITGIIAMYMITRKWSYKIKISSKKKIIESIKSSTDVFINDIMPNFYNSFSVISLGYFSGSISNGLLEAGMKFTRFFEQVLGLLSQVFFPFLSRKIEKHNIFIKLNIYSSLLFSIVVFLLAPFVIKLFYTQDFYNAIIVLRITAFSIFFSSLINVYGTNFLLIKRCEKVLRRITVYSSFIGFALSFPLIYYFDYIGAAVTITLTKALLGVSLTYKAQKIKRNEITN